MAFGGDFRQQYINKTGAYDPQVTFNKSPFGSAFNAGMVHAGPQFGQIDAKYGSLLRGGALENQGYGLNQEELNLGYESQMSDLGTSMANNAIDIRGAARQPNLIDQLLASQNKDFDISRAGLATEFGQKRYDLNSDATARGAYNSGGTQQGRKTLFEQLSQGMGHLEQQQTQNTLTAEEQKAQAKDRLEALNNTAANLSMKPAQLQKQLELGLKKAGLSHLISANDLLDAVTQNNLQGRQLLNDIILGAGQYATAREGKNPNGL